MQKLSELLRSEEPDRNHLKFNKKIRPEPSNCPQCGNDKVEWFWLESEAPALLGSRWMRQVCACVIMKDLTTRYNTNADLIKPGGEQIFISRTKTRLDTLKRLIGDIKGMSNAEYCQKGLGIASQFPDGELNNNTWWYLFDCNSKAETRFMLDVLREEQPEISKAFYKKPTGITISMKATYNKPTPQPSASQNLYMKTR